MNKPIETFEEFLEKISRHDGWFLTDGGLLRCTLMGYMTCPICFVGDVPGAAMACSVGILKLGMPQKLVNDIINAADHNVPRVKTYRQRMLEKVGLL